MNAEDDLTRAQVGTQLYEWMSLAAYLSRDGLQDVRGRLQSAELVATCARLYPLSEHRVEALHRVTAELVARLPEPMQAGARAYYEGTGTLLPPVPDDLSGWDTPTP